MRKLKIEDSIKRAINEAPLLDFDEIAKQPYIPMKEHDYITKQVEKKGTFSYKNQSLALTFCMLLLVIGISWIYQNKMVDSIITLDVNPSIKIVTNRKDKVILVKPINKDGKVVVENLNFKNEDVYKVVEWIMETMYKEGYITLDKNSILVSANNRKREKADLLLDMIGNVIEHDLSFKKISNQVILQVISKDTNISKLAKQYGVSEGKMQLVQLLINKNPGLTIENLVNMSVDELIELAKQNGIEISIINYVSKDKDQEKNNIAHDFNKNNTGNKEIDNNNGKYGNKADVKVKKDGKAVSDDSKQKYYKDNNVKDNDDNDSESIDVDNDNYSNHNNTNHDKDDEYDAKNDKEEEEKWEEYVEDADDEEDQNDFRVNENKEEDYLIIDENEDEDEDKDKDEAVNKEDNDEIDDNFDGYNTDDSYNIKDEDSENDDNKIANQESNEYDIDFDD